jgi:putative transposase
MNNKTHTIRLFPDASQEKQLYNFMCLRNIIWNKLVSIREQTYQSTKKGMSDFDLIKLLPKIKKEYPELKNYNSRAAQAVAKQIGSSYRSFFRHLKNGDRKARPPGIVDENKIVSIVFNQSGWKFKKEKIKFSKIDNPILFKSKDDITKLKIKEVRIKLINNKWLCDLIIEYKDEYQENKSNKVLAVDLGLKSLATGIDNDGKVIILNNKAKKIAKYFGKQIAKVSKQLSIKTKDSNQHKHLSKVRTKLYNKKNAQVKQTLHIQSKKLSNMNYQTIVLGDLSVKELMSKEKSYKGVRKSFSQSSIDTFRQFLTYKCQGKTNVVEIDERHTTQLNCLTGKKFSKKVELKDRIVQLAEGIIIDRDLNSAINILRRWESYHLAALIPPLELSGVLKENNLFQESTML